MVIKGFVQRFMKDRRSSLRRKKAMRQVMFGCALAGSKQIDDAIPVFRQAIEIDPDCAEAHFALGLMYAEKGMSPEAAAEYDRAVEINPDFREKIPDTGQTEQEGDRFDIVNELRKNI